MAIGIQVHFVIIVMYTTSTDRNHYDIITYRCTDNT